MRRTGWPSAGEGGRRAEVEPTYVHPQYALVHAAHCLLGIAGSLVAVAVPALGFGLVLFAATSMYLDLNYRFYLAPPPLLSPRLAERRLAWHAPGPPARLIITAHLDAAQTGPVSRGEARRAARPARARHPLGPFRLLFWSLALLLPLLGARMAGVDSDLISRRSSCPPR